MQYLPNLFTFFREEQSIKIPVGFSRSPNKPKLLLDWLKNKSIHPVKLRQDWNPFGKDDFLIAHTEEYVDSFFEGGRLAESNGLSWNPELARSVRYTSASLYEAIKNSLDHPEEISFSPTSGFHHATPESGRGFCTFSGQVIASVKHYRERGVSGAYIDLDEHFGNSIEDSRDFCPDLNLAVPSGANVNPDGRGQNYIKSLEKKLQSLKAYFLENRIQYVVICSGADSLEDDDLGSSLALKDWLHCKRIVYQWILDLSRQLGRQIPVTITLFGGYRQDHFESVLDAHTQDLLICLEVLSGIKTDYVSVYRPRNLP
jgi:acetoin utilization deacetylase AcuC-like enzyme